MNFLRIRPFSSNFTFEIVCFKNGQAAGSISEIYLGLSAAFPQNARPQKMHLQKGSASSGANNSLWAYLQPLCFKKWGVFVTALFFRVFKISEMLNAWCMTRILAATN